MNPSAIISAAIFLSFTVAEHADATHILGGQITAKALSNQNYSYQIVVHIYAQKGAPLIFGNFELGLGFGAPILGYEPFEYTRTILDEDSAYYVNTYLLQHTYPGPGEYLIYVREFNRTSDIINMNSSVTTPFYMETKLIIDPLIGNNSTPTLIHPSRFEAQVNNKYVVNIGATDPDGDSLSYALVVPKQNKGTFVEGYYAPHRLGLRGTNPPAQEDGTLPALFTFEEGTMVWNAPAYGGQYTLAFQVKEWRKVEGTWEEIGYVTRDITVLVQDTLQNTPGYITDTQDEEGAQTISFFPNPTDGAFTLKIHERWYHSGLVIQDMLGRKVYEVPVLLQKTSFFDLQHLSAGLYILRLQKGVRQHTLTFVKK